MDSLVSARFFFLFLNHRSWTNVGWEKNIKKPKLKWFLHLLHALSWFIPFHIIYELWINLFLIFLLSLSLAFSFMARLSPWFWSFDFCEISFWPHNRSNLKAKIFNFQSSLCSACSYSQFFHNWIWFCWFLLHCCMNKMKKKMCSITWSFEHEA